MRIEDKLPISLGTQVQGVTAASWVQGVNNAFWTEDEQTAGKVQGTRKTECQTCKERKYQDGSDEMVSFKASAHISPEASASTVRAHEQEHVSNAFKKAAQGEGKVLQASVRLQTAICPECGRSYVAGGTTTTRIQYKEDNPYGKNTKALQAEAFKGKHVDEAL